METVNYLVYSTDKNYWMHLYVSLYSLLKNNQENKFIVYILTDQANETFLSNTAFLYKIGNLVDCIIIKVDQSLVETFPVRNHFTKATYYRLFIGQLLPDDIKKVLYLDCDTIIEKPLNELFNIDLSDYVIGAAPDDYFWGTKHSYRLGLAEKSFICFNAGVMLINLEKWRSKGVENKLINYIKNNYQNFDAVDQDVLNAVLYNECKEFSQEYNFTEELTNIDQVRKKNIDPSIIHYIWGKPWFYLHECLFKDRYWFYLKETPYREFIEEDRKLKNILAKNTPFLYKIMKSIYTHLKLIKNNLNIIDILI